MKYIYPRKTHTHKCIHKGNILFNDTLNTFYLHLYGVGPISIYKDHLGDRKSLNWTEEPAKVGTCARVRRALHQLARNVHVKHSDLT